MSLLALGAHLHAGEGRTWGMPPTTFLQHSCNMRQQFPICPHLFVHTAWSIVEHDEVSVGDVEAGQVVTRNLNVWESVGGRVWGRWREGEGTMRYQLAMSNGKMDGKLSGSSDHPNYHAWTADRVKLRANQLHGPPQVSPPRTHISFLAFCKYPTSHPHIHSWLCKRPPRDPPLHHRCRHRRHRLCRASPWRNL